MKGYFAQVKDTDRAPVSGYNTSGRGVPDISAAASSHIVINRGVQRVFDGTSGATPIVAAMLSLVNAARFRAGGRPIGFLHPALYKQARRFTRDVTAGKNNCTALDSICCTQGFNAAKGWDPTTGFGTINHKKFKAYMMSIDKSIKPTSMSAEDTHTYLRSNQSSRTL